MKKNFLFIILAVVVAIIPVIVMAYQSYLVRSVYYEGINGNACIANTFQACQYELNFPSTQPNWPSLCGIGVTSIYGAVSNCGPEVVDMYGQCGKICTGTLRYDGYTLTQSSCSMTPGYPQYLCEFSGATCGYPLGVTGQAWVLGCVGGGTEIDSFSMSVIPITQSVAVGGSAVIYNVNISNTYIGVMNLSLSGCPAGSVCTLNNSSLSFVSGTSDDSRNVTLTVTPGSVASGTYNITVGGNIGGIARSAVAQMAVVGNPPEGYFDAPLDGANVSGPAVNLEGWAIDNWIVNESKIQSVKIYLDGVFVSNANLNVVSRPDVCASHVGWLDCPNAGWKYSWNASSVSVGAHVLKIEIRDNNGGLKNVTKNITVSASPSLPNLTASDVNPTTATASTPTNFSSIITNNGTASTGVVFPNHFQVRNPSAVISTISALNTAVALTAGNNVTVTSGSYTFPSAGSYSIRACADNNASMVGVVVESNEGDNCGGWTPVTVSNLAGTVPTVNFTGSSPASPVAVPGLISLSWNVSNNATTCTASGGWSGTKPWANGAHTEANISISGTTSYTIVCSNAAGNSAPSTITISAIVPNRTVTVTPSAGGTVKSVNLSTNVPDGIISCPPASKCSHSYPSNTSVKFVAIPSLSNWRFVGWTAVPQVCTGAGDCSFLVTQDVTIQAIFSPKPVDYREF